MRRIILEITRTSLRVLVVEGTGTQWHIRHAAVEPITEPPDEATLRRALAVLQPLQAERIVAVSRDQVMTRLLKLPLAQADEWRRMALLAGKAQLPVPAEQTVTDVQLIAQDATTSTVQLIACHRDVVEQPLRWLRTLGGEPQVMTPSSWGVLHWYQHWGRTAAVTEPVLVVHVDSDHTELALIHAGSLAFSRSLTHGVGEWQRGADGIEAVVHEIQRSLEALRQELPAWDARTVLLTGLGSLEDWRPLLAQRLGLAVVVVPPAGSAPWPQPQAFAQASPVVVLGLARADAETLVNLLPQDVRQQQRAGRRHRALRVTAALLAAAFVLGLGVLWAWAHRCERFLAQATVTIQTLEAQTAQTERLEQQLQLIEQTLHARRQIAKTLETVFQLTPADIFFEQVLFERSHGEWVVRGHASTTRDVLDYLHRLEQSSQWSRVELRYAGRRNTAGPSRTEFELALRQRVGS